MLLAQSLEKSRRFDNPHDEINLDRYLQILHNTPSLLLTQVHSDDPKASALFQQAQNDIHRSVIAINQKIKSLMSILRNQCGSTKCKPNEKSKCATLICQAQSWVRLVNDFHGDSMSGYWYGMDRQREQQPMQLADLIEVKIHLRRTTEIYESALVKAASSLSPKLLAKIKRQFRNTGGNDTPVTLIFTIILVAILLLIIYWFYNVLYAPVPYKNPNTI